MVEHDLEREISSLREGAARTTEGIADFRGLQLTAFEEVPELRCEMMDDRTVRLFVPMDEIRADSDFPPDERYVVGNKITLTMCGAIGRYKDWFKYTCTCGQECRSGFRPIIGAVIPIFSLPRLREASRITGIKFVV